MADDAAAAEAASVTFNVKASNDAKYTFTLPDSTTVLDLKEKLSSSEHADTPADRQRLIYSGRVLKDNETLATYKIKDGHTIHLVKSAASNQRQNPTPQAASSAAGTTPSSSIPGVPTNIAAGTGNNPLAGLTGARYAGFAQLPGAGMFGPDGGMGPPPDPDAMLNMLENPQVQATMNEALQNPALIDLMIQQNPMLRDMGPGVRQMMQSPEFRRMLTDPAAIRQMAQMQRSFGGMGFGGAGNAAFPAPGVTNTTPEENRGQQQPDADQTAGSTQPVNPFGAAGNPFAGLFGINPPQQPSATPSTVAQPNTTTDNESNTTGGQVTTDSTQNQQNNPFAALFNPAMLGFPPGQAGTTGAASSSQAGNFNNMFNPQNNPFLRDPALLSNVMQAMGGGNASGNAGGNAPGAENPWASLFGAPPQAQQQQQDNLPPEERYAEQLRQLNDMGFYDFDRNITALRRSGGSVQGAIDYLLSGSS